MKSNKNINTGAGLSDGRENDPGENGKPAEPSPIHTRIVKSTRAAHHAALLCMLHLSSPLAFFYRAPGGMKELGALMRRREEDFPISSLCLRVFQQKYIVESALYVLLANVKYDEAMIPVNEAQTNKDYSAYSLSLSLLKVLIRVCQLDKMKRQECKVEAIIKSLDFYLRQAQLAIHYSYTQFYLKCLVFSSIYFRDAPESENC